MAVVDNRGPPEPANPPNHSVMRDRLGVNTQVEPASLPYEALKSTLMDREDAPRTRQGLDWSPALFLWENRTTNVDVMSVSNTTRPIMLSSRNPYSSSVSVNSAIAFHRPLMGGATLISTVSSRNSERRRIQAVLPFGLRGLSTRASAGENRIGVVAHSDAPNTTALEAQLNEARRAKHNRYLLRERQVFLARLTREREERVMLEAWAASRVQAVFRGFLVRPRPPRLRRRKVTSPAEAEKKLVADLQAILARAGLPTIPGVEPDGVNARGRTEWGQGRHALRGEWGATRLGSRNYGGAGGKWSRSRNRRNFEDDMALCISRMARGFLGRRYAGHRREERDRMRQTFAAVGVQRAWSDYRARINRLDIENGQINRNTKIQARWRGVACRMALANRQMQDALLRRRTVSAVTIQTAARRRLVVIRFGEERKLSVACRTRGEIAVGETFEPRRRWNRSSLGAMPKDGTESVSAAPGISPIGDDDSGQSLITLDVTIKRRANTVMSRDTMQELGDCEGAKSLVTQDVPQHLAPSTGEVQGLSVLGSLGRGRISPALDCVSDGLPASKSRRKSVENGRGLVEHEMKNNGSFVSRGDDVKKTPPQEVGRQAATAASALFVEQSIGAAMGLREISFDVCDISGNAAVEAGKTCTERRSREEHKE